MKSIESYCKQAFIPNTDLYSGQLESALTEIKRASESKEKMSRGGAELAEKEILDRL
ncbi:MAG: hypothetical protein V3V05_05465 [Pontiella sp.]